MIPGEPATYDYSYDLSTIINVTTRLGIPWHPILKKGHDFASNPVYCGFDCLSLPEKKRIKYSNEVVSYLSIPKANLDATQNVSGSLQHATFVYTVGHFSLCLHYTAPSLPSPTTDTTKIS